MQNDNTSVLLALIGIGIAAVIALGGFGGSSGSTSTSVSRDDVVDNFQSEQGVVEQVRQATSGSSDSSSSPAPGEAGFAQQVVERTGYLPSGFDAAGRISSHLRNQETNDYETGDGFVGL